MKKVSLIVPVYNAERTLHRCVDSMLAQTYENIEIILVDDGSKDNSLAICKEYEGKHENVKVFSKVNAGVSDTRNAGIAQASGDYLQFVDSDDFILENMCDRMVSELEKQEADMVMCAMTIQHGDERISDTLAYGLYEKDEIAKKLLEIYKTNYVNSPCNKLYKKELVEGGFCKHLSLGEDLLFNLQYLKKCDRVVCIEDALYVYDYVNENSLTQVFRENTFDIATELYKAVCEYGEYNKVGSDILIGAREVYLNSVFYAIQDLFYYSKLSGADKMARLKEWGEESYLKECLNKTYAMELQKQLVCRLLKMHGYPMIWIFFKIKNLISKILEGRR